MCLRVSQATLLKLVKQVDKASSCKTRDFLLVSSCLVTLRLVKNVPISFQTKKASRVFCAYLCIRLINASLLASGKATLQAGIPNQVGVPASFNYAPGQVVPLPTPKLPVTWRTPAVQLPLVSHTRKPNSPKVSQKESKQHAVRAPVQPAQAQQSAQEEASGYMSTESDSDRPTQDKGKVQLHTA